MMAECIKKFRKGNQVLKIYQDDNPESPREWDNLGIMVCKHSRYKLGDEQTDFNGSAEEFEEFLRSERHASVILPLYLYDHSGISISTTQNYPFNDRWDASMVGFIYTTDADIKKDFILNGDVTDSDRDKAREHLIAEVETYNQFLVGDIYCFHLVEEELCNLNHIHENVIDSCCGFYGSDFESNGLIDSAGIPDFSTWEELPDED
jgi:hypothetical protein